MGRATYEIERAMTSGRIRASRPSSSPAGRWSSRRRWSKHGGRPLGLADELRGRGYRKIGVEGGGQLDPWLVAIGRLDVLEMAIIPLVLGDGIPLFPSGTPELPCGW